MNAILTQSAALSNTLEVNLPAAITSILTNVPAGPQLTQRHLVQCL